MKTTAPRWPLLALAAALLAPLLPACLVRGGAYGTGYDTSVGVGVRVDGAQRAPDPLAQVGPSRGGGPPHHRGEDRAPPRYRPAPPTRPMPSIPARPRARPERTQGLPGHPSPQR